LEKESFIVKKEVIKTISSKYFSKKLFCYNIDFYEFCIDCNRKDEGGDCDYSKKNCPILKEIQKKNYITIYRKEFSYQKIRKIRALIDNWRVIMVLMGKQDPTLGQIIAEYQNSDCKQLEYMSNRKLFKCGINFYAREHVYFALKCIKNPEILIDKSQNVPLVIRNDKITIWICTRIEEVKD